MRGLALVVALAASLNQVANAGGIIDFGRLTANTSLSSAPGHRHLVALASPTCALVLNVDFAGNDIANVQAPAATDCCTKCSAQSGCTAFTWTNWNGGTCWLKSKKGATRAAKPGAQSAELVTSSGASCSTLEAGVDYVANDIGSVAAPAAADCCAKCSAKPGCGAFTWTNWDGGTCWFKSGKGATKANPDAYSSTLASTASCAASDTNVDYYGADIASVPGSGAPDCCTKCSARTGCAAFTWTNANGGTCWLKNGKGSPRALSGAVSAVVSSTTTAPPTQPPASGHIQSKLRSGELPLRSVNLGGWLVGEYWMSFTSPAWTDTNGVGWDGEYLTMKALGKTKGTAQFEQHRASWITETDLQQIAAAGMNAVRVPVGFWIMYDDPSIAPTAVSQVFAPGALKYLDTLVNDWAVKYNLAVMLSLHAHQGSQNGYDHSSPLVKGTTSWSDSQANIDNSLQFATFLAARYKNSVAFLGMNLMNEPSFPTDYNRLFGYYQEAYTRIRATGNTCVLVTSPMIQEQGPPVMMNFMRWPAYFNVWHEFHVYYKWGWDNTNVDMILNGARSYRASHLDNWSGNWIYMETRFLPSLIPINDRNQLKEFAAIQMAGFEGAHSGWAFWSWRHDDETVKLSGWSLRQLLREGILTVPRVN